MGPAPSKGNSKQRAIDNYVRDKREDEAEIFKLLLLGAGESGKSTVLKQILLSHGPGFDETMRQTYRNTIAFNILDGARHVIEGGERTGHTINDKKTLKSISIVFDALNKYDSNTAEILPPVATALISMFADPIVKDILRERHLFQLDDNWTEFMTRLQSYPTWGGPEWVPSDEDILMSRVITTGIVHQRFRIKQHRFEMIDVGGQKAERRKWFGLFNKVSGIIFVTSLSEYNQTMYEEVTTNRLTDSVYLWKDNANRPEFKESALLLFFNKFDLFQQKYYYDKVPLTKPIPSAPTPPLVEDEENDNCVKAIAWFENLFRSQVASGDYIFVHTTCALDKEKMEKVIDSCSRYVLERSLKSSGLV